MKRSHSLIWVSLVALLILAGCQSPTDEKDDEPAPAAITTASDAVLAKFELASTPLDSFPDDELIGEDGKFSYTNSDTNITYVGSLAVSQANGTTTAKYTLKQTLASTPTSEEGTTASGAIDTVFDVVSTGDAYTVKYTYKGTLTLAGTTTGTVAFDLSGNYDGTNVTLGGTVTIDGTKYSLEGYAPVDEE